MLERDPKVAEFGPDFFRLVMTEPEIAALAPSAHSPWIAEVASFIASRRPALPPAVAHAIAAAYQSVMFAALIEWAASGAPGNADDAVDAMLVHLGPLADGE
ncbi:hypothetical protein GCM10009860_21470 [Microbacterium mitrae]|uniref:acyl-CoA-like ligand-binding transcription factor n=1 Tax=Microbacterium mitrae TaxID=664640 RepID=UPI00164F3FE4|nr:hypothetical protein [Microbacterium mitrae]